MNSKHCKDFHVYDLLTFTSLVMLGFNFTILLVMLILTLVQHYAKLSKGLF